MNPQTLARLNQLAAAQAEEAFLRCCGCRSWAQKMTAARPFADDAALTDTANRMFAALSDRDWLEAFEHHPRIGDISSLRAKFIGNREWSAGEQSGMNAADEKIIHDLADANNKYFDRFGYTFIVCATGKTAAEMLAILRSRLGNDPRLELQTAASEQRKITALRLEKLQLT